jgi:hypothetical protein
LLLCGESAKLAVLRAWLKRLTGISGRRLAMKFNIEIDCTPEEARRLFGLPDLEPLHDIYLDRVKELMAKGITPDMVQSMVKTWVPMGGSGLELVQSLLGQFGGGLMGGASKSADKDDDDKSAKGRKS